MASPVTDIQTMTTLPDTIRAIYSEELNFTATPKLVFDQFTEAKSDFRAKRGERVYWTIFRQLPPAINALTENQDVDGGQMADFQVSFTVNEYGYALGTTEKLDLLSYFGPISNMTRQVLAPQMALTLDLLARNAMYSGTYKFYGGTASSRGSLAAGDKITEDIIRQIGHNLSVRRVPLIGGAYAAIMHPSVTYDVRALNGWTNAHLYAGGTNIFNGEVGMLHGVRFVEADNARLPNAGTSTVATTLSANAAVGDDHIHVTSSAGFIAGQEISIFAAASTTPAGDSAEEEHVVIDSVDTGLLNLRSELLIAHSSSDKVVEALDVYPITCIGGQPAVGKGVVVSPEVRVALPTDKLRRMSFVGWYALLGYGIIRNWSIENWEVAATRASAPAYPW